MAVSNSEHEPSDGSLDTVSNECINKTAAIKAERRQADAAGADGRRNDFEQGWQLLARGENHMSLGKGNVVTILHAQEAKRSILVCRAPWRD
uniref:Uncharacterized protein n=1 Tax=Ralstonia solanacearum TaxID=305 RepID=A0A0S4UL60_RALSL|nr:protein of unknown function [Ralstonia solanacearum]